MLAASYWSLLAPAIEQAEEDGMDRVLFVYGLWCIITALWIAWECYPSCRKHESISGVVMAISYEMSRHDASQNFLVLVEEALETVGLVVPVVFVIQFSVENQM